MTTTTTTVHTLSRQAETLARMRSILKAAGHRPGAAQPRLNLAEIRERRAAEQAKARSLARFDHRQHAESYIWQINWRAAATP